MRIEKNEDKCSECMLCVRDCVMGVWRVVDGKSTPEDIDLCNCCSHCIAVCPCDAISHDHLKKEQISVVNRINLNPDVYRDIVSSRRSTRQFKNQPVPREMIERILDLARYAPTASNNQNVGYIVITDKRLIEETAGKIFGLGKFLYNKTKNGIGRLLVNMTGLVNNRYLKVMDYAQEQNTQNGRDFILHNAPVLILIHAPKRTAFASDNCNIAATTIINYAHALGLGTCYIGFMTMALQYSGKLRKKLGVPENRRIYASLVMGYPAYRYANTVSKKNPEVQWL
ncbi:MAG: nitroreductase [Deltaproteobacteria bacterium HGW-Deltaproteobacteria-13]|jgi:nitroreductase/NAD-dependent dihydropyrimidine dehydrogenase PreA subunit|nr:MAG: nitroreductase [Deltaproteobacteria bacterium HGW-Deltaproteobacteria-13]